MNGADTDGAKFAVGTTTLPDDIGAEGTTYGESTYTGITAYANGLKYDNKYYMSITPVVLSFADNADNTTVINDNYGLKYNVTLNGRTLYKDGDWNTLCLPFSVTDFTGTPLEGATVKELLTTSNLDGAGKLTLNFEDATTIEAGKPYLVKWTSATPDLTISTASDWVTFASKVNDGTDSYEGKLVKLAGNISVSKMVGTESNKFKGTFDGAGHTLTISLGTEACILEDEYAAPFRYVDGATIKNLHIAGDIYTQNQFAGGLIAESSGSCAISNCRSSVAIHSNKSGDGTHGGFIGVARGSSYAIRFTDCLFDGQLLMMTKKAENCGGFVGWHEGYIYFTGCYFNPFSVTLSTYQSATMAATLRCRLPTPTATASCCSAAATDWATPRPTVPSAPSVPTSRCQQRHPCAASCLTSLTNKATKPSAATRQRPRRELLRSRISRMIRILARGICSMVAD